MAQPVPTFEGEPVDAERGVEMEDTSFLEGQHDVVMPDDPVDVVDNSNDMVALVDVLQTLGVEPVMATNFASRMVRRERTQRRPTFGCPG